MALQKSEDTPYGGPTASSAYHRAVVGSANPDSGYLKFEMHSYWTAADYSAGAKPYITRPFAVDLNDAAAADLAAVLVDKSSLGAATDLKTELYDWVKAETGSLYGGFFASGTTDV